MKTMKTMMVVAAFSLAIESVKASTVTNTVVGPYDKGNCGLVVDMYQEHDFQALAQFVVDGKGYVIKAGATVSALDVDVFGGVEKVRVRGESRGVWVPLEFVKQ